MEECSDTAQCGGGYYLGKRLALEKEVGLIFGKDLIGTEQKCAQIMILGKTVGKPSRRNPE